MAAFFLSAGIPSFCVIAAASAGGATPDLLFYAPLDHHLRGVLLPHRVGLESAQVFERAEGVVGAAARVDSAAGLEFPLGEFLSSREGAVAVWLKVNWDPKQTATRWLINLGKFGGVWKWQHQQYLTYMLWYHHIDEVHDYGCTYNIAHWRPGQWHHVVISWSWQRRWRALFVDGKKVRQASIKRPPNVISCVRIGPDVQAADELCVYSTAIDEAEVLRLYAAGKAGEPAFRFASIPPAVGAIPQLPPSQPKPPPKFVNWSLDGAEARTSPTRTEVTLHGWWRWQLGKSPYDPPGADWLYRKVPNHSHFAESFPPRDDRGNVVAASDPRVGKGPLNGRAQWCEREFALPDQWRHRRLVLRIGSLIQESAVWLNGKLLAVLPRVNLGGEWDITELVNWAEPNRLTIFSHGVDGTISLLAQPRGARIDDAWMTTSWRRKAVQLQARLQCPARLKALLEVRISHAGRTVKTLRKQLVLSPGTSDVLVEAPWPDAMPWSLGRPYLYEYTVALRDPGGRLLDSTFPTRFGFREIWIDDGDFYLNGRPVHFIGHSNCHIVSASELGDPAYIRYSLRRFQAANINTITPWQGESRYPDLTPLLDAADELGVAIFPIPWLPRGEYKAETPQRRREWNELHRRYIQRYRQHPSVLAWMIGSGSHVYDLCPAVLDGRFTPAIPKVQALRKTWRFVREVDPTRPVFGLSNGNIGSVWTSMAYQGFDVDLQERENWPLRWAQTRRKPLMPCEFSLPYARDWYARPATRSGSAQYRPAKTTSLVTEYAAMFFGPRVYGQESQQYLASLDAGAGRPTLSPLFWEVKKLFAETLRSWRAWGISFIYHAEVPGFFAGLKPRFPSVSGLDPRRFGATPDTLHGSLQAADELSEFGRRVKAATEPLMAFIGGPDGRFTLKDHCYWAGETVRKAVVIVNDSDGPQRILARWRLLQRGGGRHAVASGTITATVPSGRQQTTQAVIAFSAPQADRRTDYLLEVEAKATDGTVLPVPPVTITVFPRRAPNKALSQRVVLYDPVGDTRAALERLGIAAGEMPARLSPSHRLIIGRHALETAEGRRALEKAGFDEAVAAGMRVLVFEQAAAGWEGTLMGLRLKRIATRRAFIRARGHPALRTLSDSDFHFLRGDSDLIEPYPDPGPMPDTYPLHFWHWGNDNIVATYALEKPQVGAARALLDCGFDLSEAALLEVARGEGLVLFCQVDVTNRAGREPVSTILMHNLIAYLIDGHLPPAAQVGLKELARRYAPPQRITVYRSGPPPVAGIHAGDLFFRAKITVPAYDPRSSWPLFRHAAVNGRSYWLTSLTAADLPTPWQRAKRARIEAALRFANGERSLDGPTLKRWDDADRLYPHNWRRLAGWQVDFDPYVYWRW